MADVTNLLDNGNSANRVDIVFVAEGYTDAERAKFLADAKAFLNTMIGADNARLNSPFSSYKNFFNANAIFVASQQSGTDQPNNNISVNTAFNSSQHLSDGRLLYGDSGKVLQTTQSALAANAQDIVIVLVNTSAYGGAGGEVAWVSAGNGAASEIVLHEIGHSFADLQDEYVDSSLTSTFLTSSSSFQNSAHVTDSLSRIPWSSWLGYVDGELGVVGTYEGGYYRATGIWRATQDSKMLHLNTPFSAPEKEAFALRYYSTIGDYLSMNTDIPGLYKAVVPDPAVMSFKWSVNGNTLAGQTSSYLDAYSLGKFASGAEVGVTTIDATGYIRKNLVSTQQTETAMMLGNITNLSGAQVNLSGSNLIFKLDSSDNIGIIANTNTTKFNYIDGGSGNDTLKINSLLGQSSGLSLQKVSDTSYVIAQQGKAMWASSNFEHIQFNDFNINTQIGSNAKTVSANTISSLELIYIAYFNRVPDADGLNYWINEFKNGMTLNQIGDAFFEAAKIYPAQTGYTNSMTNTQFINTIYKNALGRPEGADSAGLNYWLNELAVGHFTKGSMVNAIIAGAYTWKGNATWGWMVDLLDNKVAVAHQFAVTWGLNYLSPEASITNGIAIASAVTSTDTSAALKLIGISDGQLLI